MRHLIAGIFLFVSFSAFSQNTVNVDLNSSNGIPYYGSVTEALNFYHGEFYWNHTMSTSTGLISANTSYDVTGLLPILPSKSITISFNDSLTHTIYGWTYDSAKNPISEIRDNAQIGTKLSTYTFTTPSNAAYYCIFTKYGGDSVNWKLNVKSTNAITYNAPIIPESFAGTSAADRMQKACDFARFTSSYVLVRGFNYYDQTIRLSSGTHIVINGGVMQVSAGYLFENEALLYTLVGGSYVKYINPRGNRDISITGVGNATLEGPPLAGAGVPLCTFTNVDGLVISGITVKHNFSSFAFFLDQVRNSHFNDIYFNASFGFSNQDGIHFNQGSHDNYVNNVWGNTGDDMVAITNVTQGNVDDTIREPYKTSWDISNIFVSNVRRSNNIGKSNFGSFTNGGIAYRSAIRLQTLDGRVMHDIYLTNISGFQEVELQSTTTGGHGTNNANLGDMYNVFVTNCSSPIWVFRPILNCSFDNVAYKDTTGAVTSVVLPDSSKNIYRKYFFSAPDFIDSVASGVEYKRSFN